LLPVCWPRKRQREIEHGTLAGPALSPHVSSVTLDDPFADGQAESGAGVLFLVQALEQSKDTFGILLFEALCTKPSLQALLNSAWEIFPSLFASARLKSLM